MDGLVGPRRAAWAVIAVLACGFCYSLGFQSGWSDATVRSDERLGQVTRTLHELGATVPLAEEGGAPRPEGESAAAIW